MICLVLVGFDPIHTGGLISQFRNNESVIASQPATPYGSLAATTSAYKISGSVPICDNSFDFSLEYE